MHTSLDGTRVRSNAVAAEVDRTLGNIGFRSLVDLVVDELRTVKGVRLPDRSKLRRMKREDIFENLNHNTYNDEDRTNLIINQGILVESNDDFSEKNPKNAAFLRLALVGAHSTWQAIQVHRAAYEESDARINVNSQPEFMALPLYIRGKYEEVMKGKTGTPEEAALVIAYALYKHIHTLRQEHIPKAERVKVPEAVFFTKGPEPEESRDNRGVLIAGAAATTVAAAAAAIAAVDDAPNSRASFPLEDVENVEVDENPGRPLRSEAAKESSGDGAIVLLDNLMTQVDANEDPQYREVFDRMFPRLEGQTTRERAHQGVRALGLWTDKSETILPGAVLEFDPRSGLYLQQPQQQKEYLMTTGGVIFRGAMRAAPATP